MLAHRLAEFCGGMAHGDDAGVRQLSETFTMEQLGEKADGSNPIRKLFSKSLKAVRRE